MVRPSVTAITLTSTPSSRSSIKIDCSSPARDSTASRASALVEQTNTPLPAASPSAFTTSGVSSRASMYSRASAARRNSLWLAVGTSPRCSTFLQKALLPSRRAASAVGPKTLSFFSWNASTMPATRGASGPTTVRSIPCSTAAFASPSMSSTAIGRFSPIRAVPALPGAIKTLAPSAESFQAIACSRPPDPTTRTRFELATIA